MAWLTLFITAIALFSVCIAVDPIVHIRLTEPQTILIGRRNEKFIQVQRDRDVKMYCRAENVPKGSDVRWQVEAFDIGGNRRVEEISVDMAATDNIHHHIEKPTDQTWMLRIRNVQVWDEGNYTCYVQLTTENKKFDSRRVQVFVPPYLNRQQTSMDTTIRENESTNLMCNASGRPTPTIRWTRTGNALLPIGSEIHYGSILPITNARPHYRGQYQCLVVNSIGSVQHFVELDIQFKPIVTVADKIVHQKVGVPAVLTCYIESNPEPDEDNLKWVKGSLGYSQTSGRYLIRRLVGAFDRITYELAIDPVMESDYGRYECQVRNALSVGTPSRGYVTLKSTDVAQASPKLGRVLQVGELRSLLIGNKSTASLASMEITLITMATCIVVLTTQWL